MVSASEPGGYVSYTALCAAATAATTVVVTTIVTTSLLSTFFVALFTTRHINHRVPASTTHMESTLSNFLESIKSIPAGGEEACKERAQTTMTSCHCFRRTMRIWVSFRFEE